MAFASSSLKVLAALVAVAAASQPNILPRKAAQIPSYVIEYAPLVYLDVNEYYLPSDIGAQITHTHPSVNFTKVTSGASDLNLSNLSSLNQADNCTFRHFGECWVYLTAKKEWTYPSFLNGTLPNPQTGETEGARSCSVIVTDHGDGTVDAFYMYFYAFNLGYDVFGTLFGNHVGDWEHTMLRFINGTPSTMWFSQHSDGQVFTYKALHKQNGRPLAFSAIGTHANYAVAGKHSRQVSVVTVNDYTSRGPLWDPIQSAYFYTFTPASPNPAVDSGTFRSASVSNSNISTTTNPIEWLLYFGKWGTKQLRDSNPHQTDAAGEAYTWEDGPTGPYDKDLNRKGTCPDGNAPCTTSTKLPKISGNPSPSQTISRPSTTSSPPGSTMTARSGGSRNSANQPGRRAAGKMSFGAFLVWCSCAVADSVLGS